MVSRIVEHALSHRLLTVFLVGLASIWGLLAYSRMPKDIYPDLNAPLVNIITENPGMASEDVERLISLPLESLLSGAPGVTRIRSESTTGSSVVTVEFEWGSDIYHARQIVSSKLEQVSGRLPQNSTQPILGPVSSRMGEVFEFAVVGDEAADPMELRSVADWTIRYRLQGVPGVSYIVNLGGFVRQFQVHVRPDMLRHHGVTISEVKNAIENSNRNFSGGILAKASQEVLVKGIGRIETLDHLRDTVITSRGGIPITVKDVADVRHGPQFRREAASYNGREAVYVTVEKQYGGDSLAAIANVKEALGRMARDLPAGIVIQPFYDQSVLILKSLEHVQTAILQGACFIVLVMVLFLWNLRSSLIASLTIPFSILIALALMGLAGVGLTVMSIGGLAIGIGKVANGSIIMVENIHRVLGEKRGQATTLQLVGEAARDVGPYLVSANLIIILVFLPLLTLGGLEGAMFRPTAFAVAAALLGSLVLNLSLQPILASYLLTERHLVERRNPVNDFLVSWYRTLLARALARKAPVVALFVLLVVATGVLYPRLGKEFVPPLDEGAILASTVMLPETSLEESVAMGRRVEDIMRSFPEVVSVARTTGSSEASEHVHPVNHSHYSVQLVPREERTRGFGELTEAMRAKLDHLPGIAYIFEQPISNRLGEMLTGTEGNLSIKLFGPDLAVLNDKIQEIQHVVGEIDGVADLQVEQTAGIPQLVVRLDRSRLSRHGVSVVQVAETIETALNGIEATDVFEGDRVTAVLIRLGEDYRRDEEAVSNLLIEAPDGQRIPLSDLAAIETAEGPQTIFRENLMRRKIALCNVVGRDIGGFVEEARGKVEAEVALPAGYFVTFGGQFEGQQRAMRQLAVLMGVVLLVIFVILFSSFGSIWQAALVLLSVPTTLVGALIALLVMGETLNVSSTIGLIALFGVCAQNDIVLIGKINDLRRLGRSLREAVVEGALLKLRPLLMTDLVMIVGVLPLALSNSTGSELHRPLAVVYVGGFLFALVLRRFFVPVLYEGLASILERPAAAR
ncbi:MAG TPA: CusA/CzcA family heavy metal efflux RND transporter [Vicinamibacterales bacterium]|nr:CusA/CzcA family heavy metal efflux RND transporter [Vicinamibacterales bacterium]